MASSNRQFSFSSVSTRDLKHRVFTCVNKLSDRDTYTAAASELDFIAKELNPDSFSVFISCIQSTNSSDKSPVRKQCVKLLGVLSESHGDALSPYLPKMLANLIKRLRDPDASVRSVCVNVVAVMAERITKPPFLSFLKPLSDAVFTEQESNSQISAAMCLAAAIEGSPDPDKASELRKALPKFERLLKVESYKAKAAVMTVIGSVIDVGGVVSEAVVRGLVPCLVGFLGSEEWAARKAAAEALGKLAVAERELLAEFKAACMKVFEKKRYDKVKAVRETMKEMLEAWKEVPDLSDQASPPPISPSSSKENGSGRRSSGFKSSFRTTPEVAKLKKHLPYRKSSPSDGSVVTTARKRSLVKSNDTNSSIAILRKPEKKPSNWKVEISVPCGTSMGSCKSVFGGRDENGAERRSNEKAKLLKPETRRGLFAKNSDDKLHKTSGVKSGRVTPLHDEISEPTLAGTNRIDDLNQSHRENDDIALIRKQLVQIEAQQSSLGDLLHKFIGSSQTGMQTLETRVHNLEVALNGISSNLAANCKRPAATSGMGPSCMCCLFPGTDFLSSKFLRKTEVQEPISTPRVTSPFSSFHFLRSKKGSSKASQIHSPVFRLNGGGGFIMNPLADVHTDPADIPGSSFSTQTQMNVISAAAVTPIGGARKATFMGRSIA